MDVASRFSEDSDDVVNNEDNDNSNSNGDRNKNSAISSSMTVWPAPLFASGSGPAQAAPATGGAAADEPDPSSSTTTPHVDDRGSHSQSSTYVEPPSQSRWSPDNPSSHGSEAGLASRVGQQVAQVGAKLADTWKENKEKLGSLLGSGSKEEKKPTKEEKGKGKAVDREIVVDPVNRGAPGWI